MSTTPKSETLVTVTVHGLDERITVDGAHEALVPAPKKVDPNAAPAEPVPVEYDDDLYNAVGRYFMATFRSSVAVSTPDEANQAIADDKAKREADAAASEKATAKA